MNPEKGQILIETTLSLIVFVVALKMVFFLFLFFWMKIWSEYNLSESIICRESQKSNTVCEELFRQKFKQGQVLAKIKHVDWKKTASGQKASVTVTTYLGLELTFRKTMTVEGRL